MKIIKRVLVGFLIVVLVGAIGLVVWGNDAYPPLQPALDALQSDAQVTVTQHDGFITFEPAAMKATIGFVFYPGGRVDYRAYSPVLNEVAAQGYFIALVKAPANFAIFDVNVADRMISQYPDIENWLVGGHSLGGIAAISYASKNQDKLKGLILWASYPIDDTLGNAPFKVLSIYGTKDIAGMEPYDRSRSLLPADTQFVVIDGGNHAQFGDYGFQAGDNPADISPEEQWMQTSGATVKFLETLK